MHKKIYLQRFESQINIFIFFVTRKPIYDYYLDVRVDISKNIK